MSAENQVNEKPGRRRRRREVEEEVVNEVEEVEASDGEEEEDDERGITERKGRITPGRRNQSAETAPTGNIVTRSWWGIREYFEGVRSEMTKVAWPNREETVRLTRIVLSTTIAAALVLGGISLAFTELFRFGLSSPSIMVGIILVGAVVGFIYIRRANISTPSS